MLSSLTLKCSNCGSNLEITSEMSTFACGYCGASQIVERRGGTVSLKILSDSISKVQVGTDKTAAELAIKRLKEEFEETNLQFSLHEKKRLEEVKQANTLFMFLWILGLIICCVLTSQGTVGIIFAIISFIAGTTAILFFYIKNIGRIKDDDGRRRNRTTNEINEIMSRISKNKKIVDDM